MMKLRQQPVFFRVLVMIRVVVKRIIHSSDKLLVSRQSPLLVRSVLCVDGHCSSVLRCS